MGAIAISIAVYVLLDLVVGVDDARGSTDRSIAHPLYVLYVQHTHMHHAIYATVYIKSVCAVF